MAIAAGQIIDVDDLLFRIQTTIRTADSEDITTTESIIDSVTASLIAGRTYRITWQVNFSLSVATDQHFGRIREDNATGTQLQGVRLSASDASSSHPRHIEAEYTALATASKTFVGTFVRTAGTGNISSLGTTTNPQFLYVDYIRG